MKPFKRDEIAAFLRSVDRHLPEEADLWIIGGAAAALSFGAESGTLDIDLKGVSFRRAGRTAGAALLNDALMAARERTGLEIPVAVAGIWEAPWEFESRFTRVRLRGLKQLRLFVPEKHDWAFMKIVRLEEKDIEDIREVAAKAHFDKRILLARFLQEMTHLPHAGRLVRHFLAMMEELYGRAEADRMEGEIRRNPKWRPT